MKYLIAVCMLVPMRAACQNYEEVQRVQAITHHIIVPPDGTLDEALALTQVWTEQILRKTANFESIELLLGDTSKDTIPLLVLYRIDDRVKQPVSQALQAHIASTWPQEGQFQAFMDQLHRYINPDQNIRKFYSRLELRNP